jgi:hypothetical protein
MPQGVKVIARSPIYATSVARGLAACLDEFATEELARGKYAAFEYNTFGQTVCASIISERNSKRARIEYCCYCRMTLILSHVFGVRRREVSFSSGEPQSFDGPLVLAARLFFLSR